MILSFVRLFVTLCIVAKRYVLQQKCLNKWIMELPPRNTFYNIHPLTLLTLFPQIPYPKDVEILRIYLILLCSSRHHFVRCCNKKLRYRRETARQLATWKGGRPSSPVPPPLLATPMHVVESETRNKLTPSVPSTKPTLRWIGHSRSFKVILIGASRNPERCVVVMCNSCRRYFWNLRRYGNGNTANSSISTTPFKFEDVPARNASQMIYIIARN